VYLLNIAMKVNELIEFKALAINKK